MGGRVEGKVALISGAGGGKGLAMAKLLVSEGATVYVSDVDEARVSEIAGQVERPERVRSFQLDVGNEAHWVAAIEEIKKHSGRLDILINSARRFGVGLVTDLSLADWQSLTATNFDGTFLGAKHAIPLMIAGGGGSIVSVISLAAIRPTDNTPNYSACNAAALNLLKTISLQYASKGVRANGVIVGFSDNSPVGDDAHDVARQFVPLGRPAYPIDIARAVLWFGSDESAYAVGSSVVLDGGWSVGLKL